MNTENNKNLDDLVIGAISRETPEFDFNKWKQNHKKEIDIFESQVKPNSDTFKRNIRLVTLWRKVGYIAASILIISSLVACFVLYRKNAELKNKLAQRDAALAAIDDTATINLYLKEHQETIAQYASQDLAASQPVQMQIVQDDILYYEFLDETEFMRPGMILIGPSLQQEISMSETPAISNGHSLTLPEARETCDFDLIAPARLHPGYSLDQISRIENRDALQLLYTNGINSISLFEQPLDGQRSLGPQDFREYAVFQNKGQGGGTILAWRDDVLSYVLIGNVEMSQLMNMAQSISAGK
jgi:hypothetical protein